MLSFFTILLILVAANAIFMVFSLAGVSQRGKKSPQATAKPISSKVYPPKIWTSKFKKSV